ncbi:MAG: hypothetical protein JXA45_02730 [Methanomassiliicoccales archaeon]|nr:hypothetical protein [Methanomassiliicoccales archaeon]
MRAYTPDNATLLYSGGLDSSLLAVLARPFHPLPLCTVGLPGSHDLRVASSGAEELGLPWRGIVVREDQVRRGVAFLRDVLGLREAVPISYELPLYLACISVPERTIITGQGADELFAGYARYGSMPLREREEALRQDLEAILAIGMPREERLAAHFQKSLLCPYLSPSVREVAARFRTEELISERGNKLPLRSLACQLGLSAAERPKKAAQYGSGIMKAMKGMAAREGLGLRQWVLEVTG